MPFVLEILHHPETTLTHQFLKIHSKLTCLGLKSKKRVQDEMDACNKLKIVCDWVGNTIDLQGT